MSVDTSVFKSVEVSAVLLAAGTPPNGKYRHFHRCRSLRRLGVHQQSPLRRSIWTHCHLMKREWSCSHPYDPYVAWQGNMRDWKNSVKFRNFRLIVRIEACGSRILHNVEVKTRSVKFRNRVSKSGHWGAFWKLKVQLWAENEEKKKPLITFHYQRFTKGKKWWR